MSDTIRWCFTHDTQYWDDGCLIGNEHYEGCDVALMVRADTPVYRIDEKVLDGYVRTVRIELQTLINQGVLVRIGAET